MDGTDLESLGRVLTGCGRDFISHLPALAVKSALERINDLDFDDSEVSESDDCTTSGRGKLSGLCALGKGVASRWRGWTMSRDPRVSRGLPTKIIPLVLGPLTVPCLCPPPPPGPATSEAIDNQFERDIPEFAIGTICFRQSNIF